MGPKPNLHAGVWLFVEALCILAYAVKPSRYRWTFFIPIFLICTYAMMYTGTNFSHLGMGKRGMSARLPMVIMFASTNILISDVQKELRIVGQKEEISKAPFLSRLWWGLLLWTNQRGINFAHEPTSHIPPRPTQTTRISFVFHQLKSMAWYFLIFDIFSIVNRANPYYTIETPIVEGWQHLWWFAGFGFGAIIYTLLAMQQKVLTMVLVLLGMSKPRDCPDYFGSPLEAYTIRRMWSKFWHQTIRRACVVHADLVARYFNLPPKSKLTTVVKLLVCFLISGVVHWISEALPMETLWSSMGIFWFFLSQVVAIVIEEMVMQTSLQLGFTQSTRWTRLIGYVWVWVWINLTLPLWTRQGYKGGWIEELPDFSIILGLWKGDWYPVNKSPRLTT